MRQLTPPRLRTRDTGMTVATSGSVCPAPESAQKAATWGNTLWPTTTGVTTIKKRVRKKKRNQLQQIQFLVRLATSRQVIKKTFWTISSKFTSLTGLTRLSMGRGPWSASIARLFYLISGLVTISIFSVGLLQPRIGASKYFFYKLSINVCISFYQQCPGTSMCSATHLTVS